MRSLARPAAGLVLCLGLLAPSAATAADTGYVARNLTTTAASGLPVSGPLSKFRAVTRARVVVPRRWTVQRAPAGQLRLLTPGQGCRYRVTFSARTVLAPPGAPVARVDAALVAPSPARLLDEGSRTGSAFRVTRPTTDPSIVTLRGLRSAVLTRRGDIAPAGQVAWADVSVTASSRPGDECHSGTYRQAVGPQLADALATARTLLRFARP
jgi:hypothetical protein